MDSGIGKGPGRAWSAYLLAGLLATGIYFLLPSTGAQNVLYGLIGISALIAVLVGLYVHRPISRLPWYMFASGLLAFNVGDWIWAFYENVLGADSPFPSFADALYLAGPLLLTAGLWLMLRERDPEYHWASLVDALIVTAVAAMLLWVFLVDPYTHDSSHSLLELLIASAYSLADVALLVIALRLGVWSTGASTAFNLLAAGLVLMAISHTVYTEALLSGSYETGDPLAAGWMLAYVLFGAAALHPAMLALTGFAYGAQTRPFWDRPALLSGLTLLAPAMLIYQMLFENHADVAVLAGGSVALSVLVAIRVGYLKGQRERAQQGLLLRDRAIAASSNGIIITDPNQPNSPIIYVNPSFERITGYLAEEVLGRNCRILQGADRDQPDLDELRASLREGRECRVVLRNYRKDGGMFWNELLVSPVRDSEGRVTHFVGVQEDITERKRAEKALREQTDTLEKLNSTGQLLSSELDTDKLVQAVTDRATELTGAKFGAFFYNLVDDFGDHYTLYTISGVPREAFSKFPMPRKTEIFGPTFRGERVVRFDDVRRSARYGKNPPYRGMPEGHLPVASYLSVPVVSRSGAVLGGLFFGHPGEGVFGQREEDIAVGLAAQAAVAMDNARLFESVRKSEERYRTIVDTANEGVWLLGADSKTTYTNRRMADMLGYKEEEMHGRPLFDFMDDEARVEAERYLERRKQGIEEDHDFRFRRKDGSELWAIVTTSPLLNENGEYQGALGMVTDITERKRIEEQLTHQALHDPLTDLPNRALFRDRLKQAVARTSRSKEIVALLFMDLDNFKVINDSLGHQAGDRLLKEAAARLQSCIRPSDTVARLGGDEFAVLIENLQQGETTIRLAQRIVEELREPFDLEGQEICVNASIGIAFSSGSTSSVAEGDISEALMRKADTAMYDAKRRGKSRYAVFEEAMDYGALKRLNLERDLRRALERQEFKIHYQPEVSLVDESIAGFEALVRWKHPKRGLLPPGEFIPLAEETGLILPIGIWVLGEACRQAKEWQRHCRPSGLPLMISVNLSARQFEQPKLAEHVSRILEETGVDPSSLNLEITETVAMEDASLTTTIMSELKALGVRISIDDFGTGYSSMSYLQRFPADYIKIDRFFVSRLGEGAEAAALVTGMVGLAHTVGMQSIAEGVETIDQLAKVREAGCDLAQGYYFSKPLPAEAASKFLRK